MNKIYLIITLVFTFGLGLLFDANAEERNCKPEMTCFVHGDFLEYSTYDNGKLVWKTTYEWNGLIDENKIFVLKTDQDFDEYFSFLINGKMTDISSSGIDVYLSSGILTQILYGYSYYVIQPSPVNVDKWLNHPTSAEDWKGKVTEENFVYKDKTRSVIVVKSYEWTHTIDKKTGILLLIEYTGPVYGNYFQELTSTNIIDDNQKTEITLEPIEPIKNQNTPSWIKNNAGWWADGTIDDQTFVNSIEFLIKENIIEVKKSIVKSDSLEQNIPNWIKNNAKEWSQGIIPEENFLKGIEFLTSNEIIKVNSNQNCTGDKICDTELVTKIVDGDTLYTKSYKIRLSLTNTPEKGKEGFSEATQFTANLCPVGSSITIDQDDLQPYDRYDRLVGKVFCGEKVLNSELLYNNHANILTSYCKTSEFSSETWAKEFGC